MNFIPKKAVNRLVPFTFYKQLQAHMDRFVLTNIAFSAIYLTPHKTPRNAKDQKRLFKKYDDVDENLKPYRKDNFLAIGDETYLVISTVVERKKLIAYAKKGADKKAVHFEMSNPGLVLLQYFDKNGNNLLTPDSNCNLDQLGELDLNDDNVKVFVNIANPETCDMELSQVK